MTPDVVIIGAGISGLTVGFFLKKAGCAPLILEADAEVGGTMKSRLIDGFLVEYGPNSALETTPLFRRLFEETGISGEVIYANPAASRRYILRGGRLHPLPLHPLAFLRSSLWSFRGKVRVLMEPFQPRGQADESVAQFVRRRLGQELLDYAINPFVAGVYAGDPEQLSIRYAFPKVFALEERYGGLILGALRGRKERARRDETAKVSAAMFSFRQGMGTLPRALASYLSEKIRLKTTARALSFSEGRFLVAAESEGKVETIPADIVVVCTPAYRAAELVRGLSESLAETLARIPYPPVAEVVFGYRQEQMGIPLDGFGFLVPEKERRRLLGTIWNSAIFPDRAPSGFVELTTFVGGARSPELVRLSDRELIEIVAGELAEIMKIVGRPEFVHITRWDRAIPQYTLGYGRVLEALEEAQQSYPGLYFVANYRGGIAVGDCVRSARATAERIEHRLAGKT